MDNTPVEEADQLNLAIGMPRVLYTNAVRIMWESISRAASACPSASSGKHRFSGYPRESARCRSCGVPLFRKVPHG